MTSDMNPETSRKTVDEARLALAKVIASVEAAMTLLTDSPADRSVVEQAGFDATADLRKEVLHWKALIEAVRDIASDRPDVSQRRSKDSWQGTALLQSSLLGEIARICGEHLRSTTVGPRPLGTRVARGPRTDAIAERDGLHINVTWIRQGTEYGARIFEPTMMDVTPPLADLLALSAEEPLRPVGGHDI